MIIKTEKMLKKIGTSLLWLGSLPLCMYTLLLYLLGYSLVIEHWLAGFLLMTMPIAMFLCIIVAISWLFIRPARAILPVVVLALGFVFVKRTVSIHKDSPARDGLKVLSYNLYGLYADDYLKNVKKVDSLVSFMSRPHADIQCFQEFYNWDEMRSYRTIKSVSKNYDYHAFTQSKKLKSPNQGLIGLAIFSKYPIIHQEGEMFENQSNGYLIADIDLGKKGVVRIINFQLWSMGIRVNRVMGEVESQDYEEAKKESRNILTLLKKGFEHHIDEVEKIERLVDASPYPVIICGDFNETPYGLAYGQIRGRLNNTFEEVGHGFGYTLNRSPWWVRIDNQFFGENICPLDFKVHSDITYSDHLPISGVYEIKAKDVEK
jgi:endonuclease/exonuclease/phosphatase (EEP) superfamily protein YafD